MGGEVVGINMDTLDNNEAGIKEAKEILKAQGASYKNLTFDSNSTVGNYAGKGNIMAFPTTVLVDKDGKKKQVIIWLKKKSCKMTDFSLLPVTPPEMHRMVSPGRKWV
jgi:hypothetical protein